MSFVSLGGDGSRPTFFELVAAERLMPSLKAATVYSLSVYAMFLSTHRGQVVVSDNFRCAGVCPTKAFVSPFA